MNKFTSIEQFRSTCKHVTDTAKWENTPLPVLEFRGTVKLHGTNASVVLNPDGTHECQSRNNVVTEGHFGFVNFINDNITNIPLTRQHECTVTVYGEWCGEGIQKGVALSQLPKMFVIFAVSYGVGDDKQYHDSYKLSDVFGDMDKMNEHNIYLIDQFANYSMLIDFNNPALSTNDMIAITEAVEAECPVGKHFGVSGVGEGVVWKCISDGWKSSKYWFKVKGEKHSVSKVKTLVEVDVVKLKSIQEFIDRVLTENRLCQGIDYLVEMDMNITQKETGTFLSWIFADIMKEESDVMVASGLDKKDVSKDIGKKAREWYFKHIDSIVGL